MYEPGMQILWDAIDKRVTVIFRGTAIILPSPFASRAEGIAAGEDYCRDEGRTIVRMVDQSQHAPHMPPPLR